MKKRKWLLRILLGILLLHGIGIGAAFLLHHFDVKIPALPYTYKLFADIGQLEERLKSCSPEPAQDIYAGDVQTAQACCAFVEYGETRFRVTGYVFPDELSAAKYYTCNVWGKRWNANREEFLKYDTRQARTEQNTLSGQTKHTVVNQCSVLLIEADRCSKAQLTEFENWLTAEFPLEYYTADEKELLEIE